MLKRYFGKNMHIRKIFRHYTLNKKRLYCLRGKIRGFIEDKMHLVMLFSSKVSSWPFRFVLILNYVILRELREGNFLMQILDVILRYKTKHSLICRQFFRIFQPVEFSHFSFFIWCSLLLWKKHIFFIFSSPILSFWFTSLFSSVICSFFFYLASNLNIFAYFFFIFL